MMLRSKRGFKTKLVCREKGEGNCCCPDYIKLPCRCKLWTCGFVVVRFWRSFAEDSELKIVVEECGEGEEGWYEATVATFRVPAPTALNALLSQGLGK
ncbi:hypothetical protein Hanom_Chr14g01265711 [Helianthus anomalus]